MLLERVEKALDENGYEHCRYSGCFDVAAKRSRSLVLLKVLTNIDSLQRVQSENLKALSSAIDAQAAVISDHTNREALCDGVMYERFELPVLSISTLGRLLSGGLLKRYCFRGGVFVDVDSEALRDARIAKQLTQQQLAERIGVTKKNIYEHESSRKKMRLRQAQRLERMLDAELALPAGLSDISNEYSVCVEPQGDFEKHVAKELAEMGFFADMVYQSPFNIVASDKKTVFLSEAEESLKAVEKKLPYIKMFSSLAKMPALAITKEPAELDIPTLTEEELATAGKKDIRRLIR